MAHASRLATAWVPVPTVNHAYCLCVMVKTFRLGFTATSTGRTDVAIYVSLISVASKKIHIASDGSGDCGIIVCMPTILFIRLAKNPMSAFIAHAITQNLRLMCSIFWLIHLCVTGSSWYKKALTSSASQTSFPFFLIVIRYILCTICI